MNTDDPRAQRTRARLHAAVLELAADRELSTITMTEVAKRAAVNRATLYQHYADLDALVTDAMEGAIARVARSAALCPLDAPRDLAPRPLVDMFEHVAANAVLYRRMLSAQGSARFANRIQERLAMELGERFRQGARPAGFGDVPVDVHAAYLAGALTGVITWWITAEDRAPAAETALAAWRLFRG
ncbi:MAG: TetR/AcrR family transcriptional regulator C-terminal domain-containing protein [Nocardiopsaceae bacterium]|nr:TetR/AcrR family transcriptional regulator C-terminal domain-containing protein [Nocardiopsaceae bacterium]